MPRTNGVEVKKAVKKKQETEEEEVMVSGNAMSMIGLKAALSDALRKMDEEQDKDVVAVYAGIAKVKDKRSNSGFGSVSVAIVLRRRK